MIIVDKNKYKFRTEDWVCTDPLCGNVNYHWRKSCNKCRKSRDEHVPPMIKVIGKSAAEKSEGIFKAEDWQCKACGNVNWARRQACNRCNTSKFDEVNMISPDEVFDDDNMSVHSSLSSLVAPPGLESDSGISSGISSDELDSTGAKKPKWLLDAMKVFKKFMDMFPPSDEGIVDEKAELDKERVRYIFLAMLLNLGEGGLPEPSGLQNMSEEDKINHLLGRYEDLPERIKKILPKVSPSQLRRVLLPGFFEMIRNSDLPTENPVAEEQQPPPAPAPTIPPPSNISNTQPSSNPNPLRTTTPNPPPTSTPNPPPVIEERRIVFTELPLPSTSAATGEKKFIYYRPSSPLINTRRRESPETRRRDSPVSRRRDSPVHYRYDSPPRARSPISHSRSPISRSRSPISHSRSPVSRSRYERSSRHHSERYERTRESRHYPYRRFSPNRTSSRHRSYK